MKKYKPVDTLYEDIYDFDDINEKSSFDFPRSGKVYTTGKYGYNMHPANRQKVTDDRVHLPPIVVGKNLVSRPPVARHITPRRHEKSSEELVKTDTGSIIGRKTPHVPRRPQKEYSGHLEEPALKTPHLGEYPGGPACQDYDGDALYRSLMEGVHDKGMLEKSPQVLEYERRNNIKHLGCKTGMNEKNTISTQASDVFMRRVLEYEESFKQTPIADDGPHHSDSNNLKSSVYQPAPPTIPKPESTQHGNNRNRRRLLYANTQLNQDVSIHNPPKPYYKPRPPTAEVEIEFELDVQEALRVDRELGFLNKELEKQKKSIASTDMEILRPTTAAIANSNLPGCSTPCLIPTAAVPYKSAGPVKAWNGENAKRGLGFRSKIKREQQEKRTLNISSIPDKIRKEMKKYSG